MNYDSVHFDEAGYCVRSIECEEDQMQASRLRHEVFSRRLGWVPSSPSGQEIDQYDRWATSLGVFTESNDLLGFVRFLPFDRPFMVEREFITLMPSGYKLRKEADTVEISRLAVAPSSKGQGLSSSHFFVLLKGLYQWSLANEIRYAYIVVEKRFWRGLLFLGFPCEPIGPFQTLPPAEAQSVAAVIDWEKFRYQNQMDRPEFLEWMTKNQPVFAPSQWQRHGRVSTPAALQECS